ncbi:MAG: TatD family hydrolase [Victivallales bacterium]|nr:TatD family hydrolase [Victivallales bacterium]
MAIAAFNLHRHYPAKNAGQNAIVSFDVSESSLAETWPGMFSIGLHPWNIVTTDTEKAMATVAEFAEKDNCVALGECGLDRLKGPGMKIQSEIFSHHVHIAESLSKPVVVHCVRAYPELIAIRKKLRCELPWVAHRFTGNIETASQLISHGIMLSFGPELRSSQKLRDVFARIPADNVFVETDDSPVDVEDIYSLAAKIKKIPTVDLKKIILQNSACFKAYDVG